MTVKLEEFPKKNKKCNYFIYFVTVSGNLLSFTTGYSYSWTSPVLPKIYNLTSDNPFSAPISQVDGSWIAAMLSLGAFFAPLAAGICAEKFGRKRTLLLFSLSSTTSYLIVAFATRVELYFFARFLMGLGCGSAFMIMPMYIGEIAENNNRGFLGTILGVILALGGLTCLIIGSFASIMMLSLTALLPLMLCLICFGGFAPESPYYLVSIGDMSNAEKSLMKLRNTNYLEVQDELKAIRMSVDNSKANVGKFSYMYNSRAVRRGLIISLVCMATEQFSGSCALLCYMESIFDATGSSIPSNVSSITLGVTQVICTAVSSLLVDRLGRKFLLILSSCGSSLSMICLGIYFFLKSNGNDVSGIFWLPVVSLISFLIFYNFGLSTLPWLVMGELFSSSIKSLASTIITMFCLLMAFIVTMFYPYLSELIGPAQSFWLFAGFCALGATFFIFLMPETKGRSFDEIQRILSE